MSNTPQTEEPVHYLDTPEDEFGWRNCQVCGNVLLGHEKYIGICFDCHEEASE